MWPLTPSGLVIGDAPQGCFRGEWTYLTSWSPSLMLWLCRPWEWLSLGVLFVWTLSVCLCVFGLTVDNKLPVLLLWVLHGVKCLLGDAVQVHIPPVLQHLKGDVSAVYHSPGRLGAEISTILLTQAYPYPLSSLLVHMDFIKKNKTLSTR